MAKDVLQMCCMKACSVLYIRTVHRFGSIHGKCYLLFALICWAGILSAWHSFKLQTIVLFWIGTYHLVITFLGCFKCTGFWATDGYADSGKVIYTRFHQVTLFPLYGMTDYTYTVSYINSGSVAGALQRLLACICYMLIVFWNNCLIYSVSFIFEVFTWKKKRTCKYLMLYWLKLSE